MNSDLKNARIRPIESKDNAQVEKLIVAVMADFQCIGEAYSSSDPEVKSMYAAYNQPGARFYVIEHDNIIYGCGGLAALEQGDPDVCELRKMYFYEELRGHGFGRQLLQICIDDAKALGYKKMYLETVERMDQARKLYLGFGFKPIEHTMGHTGHSGCDNFYLKVL
ncbi:MAG: GNAT family N-acetyltransferase [Saprospiraceae bacterium]|nr:GNAT family N-acetyltransferase [Saprospiraceae bacterium]